MAVLSLVSSLGVISVHESVKVVLQILHRPVETFSEGDRIELLLNRLVKLFRHAIGLRMTGFGPRVLNVIEVQEKLIGMGLRNSTVLGASIREGSKQSQTMFIEEGQHFIVEEVCSGDSILFTIHLCEANVRIGINAGLLVDLANALDIADVIGVLT